MIAALWLAGFIAGLGEADRMRLTIAAEREAGRQERAAARAAEVARARAYARAAKAREGGQR